MTPKKPQSDKPWWVDYVIKNKEWMIVICILFGPEVKQVITHYSGIHFSQDAVESTMILQKLDGLAVKLDDVAATVKINSGRITNLENNQVTYEPSSQNHHSNHSWHPSHQDQNHPVAASGHNQGSEHGFH